MIEAAELAGFLGAHAIWCVSDGETLIPILGYTDEDGKRQMTRLAHEELSEAVEAGKRRLAENDMDANDAVLLYDTWLSLDEGKLDAIVIEMRSYFSPASKAVIAVPYTPADCGGFSVHRPKILTWEQCDDFDLNAVVEAFFSGIAGHEKGAEVWNRCLDESK